jgi:hypothetical protein
LVTQKNFAFRERYQEHAKSDWAETVTGRFQRFLGEELSQPLPLEKTDPKDVICDRRNLNYQEKRTLGDIVY